MPMAPVIDEPMQEQCSEYRHGQGRGMRYARSCGNPIPIDELNF